MNTVNHPEQTRNPGFTILHMVIALSLLGVFMIVASQLFLATTKAQREAVRATQTTLRSQRLIEQLREDVWHAREIETAQDNPVLRLTRFHGNSVVFRYADSGELIRVSGNQRRVMTTADMPRIRFEVKPGYLTLRTDERTILLAAPSDFAWKGK